MGLYEEAVDLALAVDAQLAKAHANRPKDPDTRKRLWLKIVRHAVKGGGSGGGGDASAATAILGECDLIRMEDILPFFPDFAVIDAFKADICASLEAYNARIGRLRAEMGEYTAAAEATQAEAAALRARELYVGSAQLCELCGAPGARARAVPLPLRAHLPLRLPARPRAARVPHAAAALGGGRADPAHRRCGTSRRRRCCCRRAPKRAALQLAALRSELDGYVAAECALCGEAMIDSMDTPLVEDGRAAEAAAWALQ
eukprot:TRINITY_DN941_c0_g1_i1.p2 TRINITY_DN941_c0_g1~~TRINITY_DN941_c0_g1_i1.p2  ORF type:complete len:296 (+),score=131.37 TRINITY_DN941_c0_g1_i1:115-888(+)